MDELFGGGAGEMRDVEDIGVAARQAEKLDEEERVEEVRHVSKT